MWSVCGRSSNGPSGMFAEGAGSNRYADHPPVPFALILSIKINMGDRWCGRLHLCAERPALHISTDTALSQSPQSEKYCFILSIFAQNKLHLAPSIRASTSRVGRGKAEVNLPMPETLGFAGSQDGVRLKASVLPNTDYRAFHFRTAGVLASRNRLSNIVANGS